MDGTCWICGGEGKLTDEHVITRCAFEKLVGKINDRGTVYFHYDDGKKNIEIQSFKNPKLTFRKIICENCNGSLTQPYDTEFNKFIDTLQRDKQFIISRNVLSFTNFNSEKLALYYVKILGCLLEESSAFLSQEDKDNFASSLAYGRVLVKNVLVSFHRDISYLALKGPGEVHSQPVFGDGYRTWLIHLDWISLLISYPFAPLDIKYGSQWNLSENVTSLKIGKT